MLSLIDAGRAGAVGRAVVMVQREMAKRITAPPGSRVYGRLTVAVAQRAEARILFDVKPGSFHPAPAVVSSVLSLVPRAAPLAPVRVPGASSTRWSSRPSQRGGRCCGGRWRRDSASSSPRRRWRRAASPGPSGPRSFRWRTSAGSRMLSPTLGPEPNLNQRHRCPSFPKSKPSCAVSARSCAAGKSSAFGGAAKGCTSGARSTSSACARWRSDERWRACAVAESTSLSRSPGGRPRGSSFIWG